MNALLDTFNVVANPLTFLQHATRRAAESGGASRVLIGKRHYLVATPELTARVLTDRQREFGMAASYSKLRLLIGNGLTVSEGPTWQRRKRGLAEQFGSEALADHLPALAAVTERTVNELVGSKAQPLANPYFEMRRHALAAISAVTFGRDLATRELTRTLMRSGDYIGRLMLSPFEVPTWAPSWARWRFERDLSSVNQAIMPEVSRIMEADAGYSDGSGSAKAPVTSIIQALVRLRAPDGGCLYDATLLRDEAMTLIMAGHESSGATIAWALHYLARDPTLQERMREETQPLAAALDGDRTAILGLAQNCLLARSVIDEVMRLNPAIWLMARTVLKPTVLGALHVSTGDQVFASPQVVHRNSDVWPEPHTFKADRFIGAYQDGRLPLWKMATPEGVPAEAYLPFGAGARLCVGAAFSRALTIVLFARLLQRCRLSCSEPALPQSVLRVVQYPQAKSRSDALTVTPI